jgi:hypothetical protein
VKNKGGIILDLCGGTGSWSKPWLDAGYTVINVTLPEYDVRTFNPPETVCGILAAPPCTEFSLAKNCRPRNFQAALEIVNACLKIIQICRIGGALKFWALENPRGYLRQFIGKPYYEFEQWEFGENKIKHTDIWGYFNKPKKTVERKPENLTAVNPNGRSNARDWGKMKCPDEYKELRLTRSDIRAITPPGFAREFFEANK